MNADALEFFKSEMKNILLRDQYFYYEGNWLKRIINPHVGDTVLLRTSKDNCKVVTIVEGEFFIDGGISNFWKWEVTESGEVEKGYGYFYKIGQGAEK